jgi:hypothetical protein
VASSHVTLPASLDAAVGKLNGINSLLRAREWERAAIVYAFTKKVGGGARTGRETGQLSLREFADLGIAGLTNRESVARYHDAWQDAIDKGEAQPVTPGQKIKLPDAEWPPDSKISEFAPERRAAAEEAARKQGVGVNKVADVLNNPAAVAAAIQADATFADKVVNKGADVESRLSASIQRKRTKRDRDLPIPEPERTGMESRITVMSVLSLSMDIKALLRDAEALKALPADSKEAVKSIFANAREALDTIEAIMDGEDVQDTIDRILAEAGS